MAGSAIATIVTSRTTTNCAMQRSARRPLPLFMALVVTGLRYG
jgi:hypothetical protein